MNKSPITYETEYIYKNGVKIGYMQLKESAYCHTAWGYLKFYSAAPYDYYANVWVDSLMAQQREHLQVVPVTVVTVGS
ncbi:hypothetical protein V2I71_13995 [Peribacillus frigoritolerans]|uniref:hypothetical protein n=1 Tax=Peribacillus frigoritolerans TaxID=450367 RepID=UPI00177CBB0B|nr:hypothetical protein [Bacillus sp. CFBP 13597]WVN08735.1 hypothetical protein V2I71_13995 [Peribacillus frigoritolerans]